MLNLTLMNILDHWIADLHIVNDLVRMELTSCADAPEVGAVLVTESCGAWEPIEVLRPARPHIGSALAVHLIEPGPYRA